MQQLANRWTFQWHCRGQGFDPPRLHHLYKGLTLPQSDKSDGKRRFKDNQSRQSATKIFGVLLTIILFASVAFPCGTPTIIAGHVNNFMPSVVTLENREGLVMEQVRSSPFGYFAFENAYTECDAPITVRVKHKWLIFEPSTIEAKEFDGFVWLIIP